MDYPPELLGSDAINIRTTLQNFANTSVLWKQLSFTLPNLSYTTSELPHLKDCSLNPLRPENNILAPAVKLAQLLLRLLLEMDLECSKFTNFFLKALHLVLIQSSLMILTSCVPIHTAKTLFTLGPMTPTANASLQHQVTIPCEILLEDPRFRHEESCFHAFVLSFQADESFLYVPQLPPDISNSATTFVESLLVASFAFLGRLLVNKGSPLVTIAGWSPYPIQLHIAPPPPCGGG